MLAMVFQPRPRQACGGPLPRADWTHLSPSLGCLLHFPLNCRNRDIRAKSAARLFRPLWQNPLNYGVFRLEGACPTLTVCQRKAFDGLETKARTYSRILVECLAYGRGARPMVPNL